jgi:dodecin
MAIMKVIEILAESNKSWEDAARTAVAEASKTLHGIKSVWVKNFTVNVENGKITSWRVNCHVSFELDGNRASEKAAKPKK